MKTIALFNSQGGVGKTTLAFHLAWMLHHLGERVLAVDLDPQANLTAAFLPDEKVDRLWDAKPPATVYGAVEPMLEHHAGYLTSARRYRSGGSDGKSDVGDRICPMGSRCQLVRCSRWVMWSSRMRRTGRVNLPAHTPVGSAGSPRRSTHPFFRTRHRWETIRSASRCFGTSAAFFQWRWKRGSRSSTSRRPTVRSGATRRWCGMLAPCSSS